jgi:hypothetical protein
MLQFHCVELSGQSCDSSMDQGERASVEHLVVAVHLQDTVGPGNKRRENSNE